MLKQLCNNFFKVNQKKINKWRAFVSFVLIISLSSGLITAYGEELHEVSVIINDKEYSFNVGNITVSELFEDNGVEINEKDKISISLDHRITQDMSINIDKAENIIFKILGEGEDKFITNSNKVGIALAQYQKEKNRQFKLEEEQSSGMTITEGMVINIKPYIEKIETITEEIIFPTDYIENPDLTEGVERIKTKGYNGVKEIKAKLIYLGGELVSKEIISETISKQPITQIAEKGTKKNLIKTEKGNVSYNKKLSMKSTAYTAGFESTGKRPGDKGYGLTASGMKARKGVVAVDTKVIPFGTNLYIEGYGYAIAGDTGGAIKGNKIDVFFDNYKDAVKYGVKNVNVYILDK